MSGGGGESREQDILHGVTILLHYMELNCMVALLHPCCTA